MDPNECYKRMLLAEDGRESLRRAAELFDWLDSGGLKPEGATPSELMESFEDAFKDALSYLSYILYGEHEDYDNRSLTPEE